MSSLLPRDLLNVALNGVDAGELKTISSGTYIDFLPKDVIQYLRGYTGQMECFYVVETKDMDVDDDDDNEVDYRAWVNKSYDDVKKVLNDDSRCIFDGEIVFVDGNPYLLRPLKKLYGLKRVTKNNNLNIPGILSKRCSGKTKSGKRCRHRITNKSYCFVHDGKVG